MGYCGFYPQVIFLSSGMFFIVSSIRCFFKHAVWARRRVVAQLDSKAMVRM
jgi:hypothetical protein